MIAFGHFKDSESNVIVLEPKFPTEHCIVLLNNDIIGPDSPIFNPMPVLPEGEFKVHRIVYFPQFIRKSKSL